MFVHCHAWNIGRLKYYAHIYLTMLSFARIGHVHLSCVCIISFYHHYFVLHVVPAKTQHCITVFIRISAQPRISAHLK